MKIQNYWVRMFMRGLGISVVSAIIMFIIMFVWLIFTTAFALINPLLGLVFGLLFAGSIFIGSFVVIGWVASKIVEEIR